MKIVKSIFYLSIVAALSVATYSCTKQADDSTLRVSIQAVNKTFPISGIALKSTALNPSITMVSGTMSVSKFEFEAKMGKSSTDTEEIEIEYKWKGPITVDLFNSSSVLGNITLPLGYYDEIELDVHLSKPIAVGMPVIQFAGNYTNASGAIIPIVFTSFEDVNFKAEQEGAIITAESGSGFTSLIQIYIDKMMLGITSEMLDSATLTSGKIEISATSNVLLYNMMMFNMKKYHHFEMEQD